MKLFPFNFFKYCSFIIAVSICSGTAKASNYYFSSLSGDDSRTVVQAQNQATPWKTLAKLNDFATNLKPGDKIYFKRSEIFYGSIDIKKSGSTSVPITYLAYGSGSKPIINGLESLSGWQALGNGVWESSILKSPAFVNTLLINGAEKALGRFPNSGYLKVESHAGKTQISDAELATNLNWNGGELVIRTNRWILDRHLILQHSGSSITYASGAEYEATNNYGYFIQNHINALDQDGEWCYNASKKTISIYLKSNPDNYNIEISSAATLVNIQNQSNIMFQNIIFKGSNLNTFLIANAQNININSCDLMFSGKNGIIASKTAKLKIENNTINYTNNNAIVYQGFNAIIRNNIIKNTGIIAGMGQSGNHNYEAINIKGSCLAEYNTIDSTGYIPVKFQGDSITIKNNFIKNFAMVKDDGGGIYTWTGANDNRIYKERKILQNIVINGTGATEATSSSLPAVFGIYLDDNTSNVKVLNNTVSNCGTSGIYLHNTQNNLLQNNTVFNNAEQQLLLVHDNICKDCPMQNNNILDNIFFSKGETQSSSSIQTMYDDIFKLGNFNRNYYSSPQGDDFSINTIRRYSWKVERQNYDLKKWQELSSQDLISKLFSFRIPSFFINELSAQNQLTNGTFDKNINGLYAKALEGNSKIEWDTNLKLNGGSLKWMFDSGSDQFNKSYLVLEAGEIKQNKKYILKFSTIGTNDNQIVDVFIRHTNAPYTNISVVKNVKVSLNKTDHTLLFSSVMATNNASIGIQLNGEQGIIWFDNIELKEADVSVIDTDDQIRFEYNASRTQKKISLDQYYFDAKNKSYSGTIYLAPYSSLVLVKKQAIQVILDSGKPKEILKMEEIKLNKIKIYPNPTSDYLQIDLGSAEQKRSVQVFDNLGRKLLDQNINNQENAFSIDVSSLKEGIYYLNILTDKTVYKEKFIKR